MCPAGLHYRRVSADAHLAVAARGDTLAPDISELTGEVMYEYGKSTCFMTRSVSPPVGAGERLHSTRTASVRPRSGLSGAPSGC